MLRSGVPHGRAQRHRGREDPGERVSCRVPGWRVEYGAIVKQARGHLPANYAVMRQHWTLLDLVRAQAYGVRQTGVESTSTTMRAQMGIATFLLAAAGAEWEGRHARVGRLAERGPNQGRRLLRVHAGRQGAVVEPQHRDVLIVCTECCVASTRGIKRWRRAAAGR